MRTTNSEAALTLTGGPTSDAGKLVVFETETGGGLGGIFFYMDSGLKFTNF